MSIELKIKSKHLSEEARIIRFEERKLLKQVKYLTKRDGDKRFYVDCETKKWVYTPLDKVLTKLWHLSSHRTEDVRNENRATFLARAYLKGQAYSDVESPLSDNGKNNSKLARRNTKLSMCILPRTLKMIQKYGKPKTTMEELKLWVGMT